MEAARPDDSREPQENLAGAKGLPERPALDRDALSSAEFLSANGIAQLTVVDTTGSTNADLLRGVTVDPKAWPDLTVLTAEHQTEARGRLDRAWEAPARSSVLVSMVLRPANADGRPLPTQTYSWLSLLAALALRDAHCWTRRESRPSSSGRTTSWSAAGKSPASWPSWVRWATALCRRSFWARG
jgi:BirA family biotin operon repressor/biotin-[acetyl-CoA-carboxylase] ligase